MYLLSRSHPCPGSLQALPCAVLAAVCLSVHSCKWRHMGRHQHPHHQHQGKHQHWAADSTLLGRVSEQCAVCRHPAGVHRRACATCQPPACLLCLLAPAYILATPLLCLPPAELPLLPWLSGGRAQGGHWPERCVCLRLGRCCPGALQTGLMPFTEAPQPPSVRSMPGGQHAVALPTALLAPPRRLPVCLCLLGSVLWGQGLLPAVPGPGPGGGGPAGAALGEQLKKNSMMCAWSSAARSI